MDVINTQNLYDSYVRRFSVGQNSRANFQADFLGAYNDVLMEMFNQAMIDEPVLLTALTDNSTVEIRYLPQIKVGLYFFLQTSGQWVKGDDVDKYAGMNWQTSLASIENAKTLDKESAGTYYSPWGKDNA